ncbi:MAG: hypothetical protein GF418_12400 [Chitinivibrionales bacterium]|nr:hypothetical protein [Chitinivibrionales bacterium]MBD3396420.1 hypothetical protein [Chitinivibrionales bacterium]
MHAAIPIFSLLAKRRAGPPAVVRATRSGRALAACLAALLSACAGGSKLYLRDAAHELADSGKVVCIVPFDSITVDYVDKTKKTPDTLFTDSFFLDAANSLLAYEVTRRYALGPPPPIDSDTIDPFAEIRDLRYSRLAKKLDSLDRAAKRIAELARASESDLVLVGYACKLKHVTYQPSGWRGSGPSYQRPVTFAALATTHVQIWNRDGRLLYECIGSNDAGRPIMYSLFGKKEPGDDVVKFAKHLYAPPLVRAMYMSIQNAMRLRRR